MDEATVKRLASLLVKENCTGLQYHGGLPLFLFDSRGLFIWSAWRVVSEMEIVAGHDSSDSVKEGLIEVITGQSVEAVSVQGTFHDLNLRFSNGTSLETFADAENYEHWYVAEGPNQMIVAGPGNLWSSF